MAEPTPITTTLLLNRLRNREDDGAWTEFDERFRNVILAAALRMGLTRIDAEEAAQETMLQAFRDYQAGKYDRARGRLSSWMVAIAHHRIIDVQRKRRRDRPGGDAIEDADDCREESVADAFEQALERRIFEQAWAWVRDSGGSDERTLRAFELTALRGLPPAETATQCDMSIDQVYVARSRVAARLRDAVERFDAAVRDGL